MLVGQVGSLGHDHDPFPVAMIGIGDFKAALPVFLDFLLGEICTGKVSLVGEGHLFGHHKHPLAAVISQLRDVMPAIPTVPDFLLGKVTPVEPGLFPAAKGKFRWQGCRSF